MTRRCTVRFGRPLAYILAALLGAVLAAGCAPAEPSPDSPRAAAPPSRQALAEAQQVPTSDVVPGYDVSIPKLSLRSDLVALGLNRDRSIQVPPLSDVGQLGLYRFGPKPGAHGPAVILGHVNGGGRPGAFARLDELIAGDHVDVTTPSGPRRFVVYNTIMREKPDFPTALVYGDTAGPELRLITCGGDYDPVHRNYLSNVLVFARLER